MKKIITYLYYELPKELYDKILLGCLGLITIGCLVFALLIEIKIQNEEKAIIQLKREIDLIRSETGKSFSFKYYDPCFLIENHFIFTKKN